MIGGASYAYRLCEEISAGSYVTETDPVLAHRNRLEWRASVHSKNDSRFSRKKPNVCDERPETTERSDAVERSARLRGTNCDLLTDADLAGLNNP